MFVKLTLVTSFLHHVLLHYTAPLGQQATVIITGGLYLVMELSYPFA
jgi:hypothetical protein